MHGDTSINSCRCTSGALSRFNSCRNSSASAESLGIYCLFGRMIPNGELFVADQHTLSPNDFITMAVNYVYSIMVHFQVCSISICKRRVKVSCIFPVCYRISIASCVVIIQCIYVIVRRWQESPLRDILLNFTQIPSSENERRLERLYKCIYSTMSSY